MGFGWLAGIAVVSTVGAITLFFAGLQRVGPTSASILSMAEPLTTVLLASLAFGEVLASCSSRAGRWSSERSSCSAHRTGHSMLA
jgi:drug/metabolite transporter (DMT)-like permease